MKLQGQGQKVLGGLLSVGWGGSLELMVGRPWWGAVGRLGVWVPGLGVVPWLIAALGSIQPHTREPSQLGTWCGVLCRLKGVWGGLGRKLLRAWSWRGQPLRTTPAAGALLLMLGCRLSLMTLAGLQSSVHLSPPAPHQRLLRPPAQPSI